MFADITLLQYPEPQAGELLTSYVLRLADANALRPVQLTALLGLDTFWKVDADVAATEDDLQKLSWAAHVSVARLRECMVMPLLQRLHADPRPDANPRFLISTGKHRGLADVRGHPVCPLCLRENGTVRREWRLTTSLVCEVHQVPLIDHCLHCQAPLHHVRGQRNRTNRLRRVSYRPECCGSCGAVLADSAVAHPVDSEMQAVLRVQALIRQAVLEGEVQWAGRRIPAQEWQYVMESLMQMHYPAKEVSGVARWRPETSTLAERWPVVVAAGQALQVDVVSLLRSWRAAGILPGEVIGWMAQNRLAGPEWWTHLVEVALYRDSRFLEPTMTGRATFQFTERQWRVLSEVIPPTTRTSRHGHPVQAVLQAWFTRNLKLTRQTEWTGKWTGGVSYPAMYKRIKAMAESGVLDDVVQCILDELPECRYLLVVPETVYTLERLGSRHVERLWTYMVEEALQR